MARKISWRKREDRKGGGASSPSSHRKKRSKRSNREKDDTIPYIAEVRIPIFVIGTCADLLEEEEEENEEDVAAARERHDDLVQSIVTECLKDAGLETEDPAPQQEGEEDLYTYVPKGASTRLPLYELSAKDTNAVQRAFHAVARMHHNYRLAHPNVMAMENELEEARVPVYTSECVAAPRRQSGSLSFLKKKSKKKGMPEFVPAPPPPLNQNVLTEEQEQAHSRPVSLPATPSLYVSDASLSTSRRSSHTSDDDDDGMALYTSPDFMDRMMERAHAREKAKAQRASDTETETEREDSTTNGVGTTTDGTSTNNDVAMEEYDSEAVPAPQTAEKPRMLMREKQPSAGEMESTSDFSQHDGAGGASPDDPPVWTSKPAGGADTRGREVPTPKRRKSHKGGEGDGRNDNCAVL